MNNVFIEVWPECGTLPPYLALMEGIIARIIQLRQDRKTRFCVDDNRTENNPCGNRLEPFKVLSLCICKPTFVSCEVIVPSTPAF